MPKIELASSSEIPPLPTGLRIVGKLSDEQSEAVATAVQRLKRFDFSPAESEQLRKLLDLREDEDISALLATLDFLYRQARKWSERPDDWPAALKHFLKTTGLWSMLGQKPEKAFARLEKFLVSNPELDILIKREWLQTGVIDRATSFASFVDLRPSYSRDRNKIDELVPVVVFAVETQSPAGENKSCIFQMTLPEFKRFSDSLRDVEQKISLLKSTSLGSLKIALDEGQE